jgi:hypothetical protein
MGSIIGIGAAALTGLVLAGVGSFTIIQLGSTTPNAPISAPVVAYGNR